MMQPPPEPYGLLADAAATGANEATQQTQQTQPTSQEINWAMETHLWGFLLPCSATLPRIDLPRTNPRCRFGRNPSIDLNDFILSGMKISNRHCVIEWDGKEDRTSVVKITDLSSNGTFINGDRIGKGRFAVLKEGNEIAFGTPQPQPNNVEDYRYVYRHLAAGPPTNGLYKHYALLEELGKGSFATVMKAMCKSDGRFYAVKMIQSNKLRGAATHAVNNGGLSENNPATVFAREISILEQLQHPNICHMKEVFIETATINLVLEWVPGGDLLDYILGRDGLQEEEARHITYQICDAMAYIHGKGIAHRDLKPENVLLTKDVPPRVKVADFGLAKAVDSLTMLRTMCGTPSYLAPEVVMQVKNEGYQNVVDSWSVGVIVFSMLTNTSPFIEPSDAPDVKAKILARRVDWSTLATRGVSDDCEDFIRGLLQERPESRMTLTDALTHRWLAGYDPNVVYGGRTPGLLTLPPGSGGLVDGDASMHSVMPADSMAMDAEPSQPGHIPGSFPPSNNASGLIRRRDIVLSTDEGRKLLPPSQEMIEHAEEEETRYYSATGQSRPAKRKYAPLDFESSLTPMPEEDEEQEDEGIERDVAEETENSPPDEDQSMADVETRRNARPKRAKATPRPPISKPARGRGGKATATTTTRATRGKGAHVLVLSDEEMSTPPPSATRHGAAPPPPVIPAQKPRRSTRLTQSPQKAGRR